MRRATPSLYQLYDTYAISIHALLAESDRERASIKPIFRNFYPRSPCGERPYIDSEARTLVSYFYPRSPCGERPRAANCQQRNHHISIHALLAESDLCPFFMPSQKLLFLSTLSLRRATYQRQIDQKSRSISIHALLAESDLFHYFSSFCYSISIHALLAESDTTKNGSTRSNRNFYPRSPCGERP